MAQNVKVRDVTYDNVPSTKLPYASGSGYAYFHDTTGATVVASHVLNGDSFFGANGEGVGTMPENGDIAETISTKNQVVAIAEGHHSGSGTVQLSATEKAKLISDNVKAGVTLLGVSGKSTVVDTAIDASVAASASTIGRGKQAVVNGVLTTGTLDSVVVSQDPNTKILTIE